MSTSQPLSASPSQSPREPAQVTAHAPARQLTTPPGVGSHRRPQAPQWSTLIDGVTHARAHGCVPPAHALAHAPFEQTCGAGHALPHAPQWAGSLSTCASQPLSARPSQSANP